MSFSFIEWLKGGAGACHGHELLQEEESVCVRFPFYFGLVMEQGTEMPPSPELHSI